MRPKYVVAVLWIAGLLSLAGVAAGMYRERRSPPRLQRVEASAEASRLQVTFVGDVMLGDAALPLLRRHGYDWPFARLRSLIRDQLVVANAEAPITTRTRAFDEKQPITYNSLPTAARAIATSGIDVLGLANNHAMDRGSSGLSDTIHFAHLQGLTTFGAGLDVGQAEKPILVRSRVGTLGIVGLAKYYSKAKTAGVEQAGTVALSPASIRRGYDLARRAGADWVVAFVHWGENYQPLLPQQRDVAREFAAAGYAAVIGAHPHVAQRVELLSGMPVVYSLGNFAFGSPGRFSAVFPGYGLLVTTTFSKRGLVSLRFRCIVTDNRLVRFQPRPCTSGEAAGTFARLKLPLVVSGDVAMLSIHPRT